MSSVDYCICIEELARVDPAVCLSIAAHNGLGSAHIFLFGTESRSSATSCRWRAASGSRLGAHRGFLRKRRGHRCGRPPCGTAITG
jgi:alkylation response protein AidB-like acyl-CoA dehydrogenase